MGGLGIVGQKNSDHGWMIGEVVTMAASADGRARSARERRGTPG
jgi:hypothetical protein